MAVKQEKVAGVQRWRLYCDYAGCKARTPLKKTEGHESLLTALRRARQRGWSQVKGQNVYNDYCPEHSGPASTDS